jgi:phage terminase large subunit-like protein
MTLAVRNQPKPLIGHARPRISPPVPARSDIAGFRQTAADMGISLMPWQDYSGSFLTALNADDLPMFRDICIVCARQNGKTTLMKPFIIRALRAGKRVMHLAQNRELPRIMFNVVADALAEEPELFPKRRGRTIWPRYGSGQEEILLTTGGSYRIAAALSGGARGHPNDIVIIDELREMEDFAILGAAEPTLTMSPYPQMVYLSNAGTDKSVILNAIRARADKDPNLAYLEWSAAPERAADDRDGWAEANPALGHYPSVLATLEHRYSTHRLSGTLGIFETEHLCRWVPTIRERLVDEFAWNECRAETLEPPKRPMMAVSMDPEGTRASAAIAWQQSDGSIALRSLVEGIGSPIDPDLVAQDFRKRATKLGVAEVGYDPLTDGELSKAFRKVRKIQGAEYANATSQFTVLVKAGKLRWDEADSITDDLIWTAKKPHDESGSFQAVRSDDDRPITAALAAIRAVWMASTPAKRGIARVY